MPKKRYRVKYNARFQGRLKPGPVESKKVRTYSMNFFEFLCNPHSTASMKAGTTSQIHRMEVSDILLACQPKKAEAAKDFASEAVEQTQIHAVPGSSKNATKIENALAEIEEVRSIHQGARHSLNRNSSEISLEENLPSWWTDYESKKQLRSVSDYCDGNIKLSNRLISPRQKLDDTMNNLYSEPAIWMQAVSRQNKVQKERQDEVYKLARTSEGPKVMVVKSGNIRRTRMFPVNYHRKEEFNDGCDLGMKEADKK